MGQMLGRLRKKNLHTWIGGYGLHRAQRLLAPHAPAPRHLIFALCDHFEPLWGKPSRAVGRARVLAWRSSYPSLAESFRDAHGRPTRHTFFFPGEEYAPEFLEPLSELASRGLGEVELHLHHDGDTPAGLRASIEDYKRLLSEHGHLSRDASGNLRYAFIHGNWSLANARADGRWCGVDGELPILFETGCYADFTFPAAPSECQPNWVNAIYWPAGDLSRRRAYEVGEPAAVGFRRRDRLLMITGPLALARRAGRLLPRIESSALDAANPPDASRVRTWVAQHIHIAGRPEWVFVKVHTHGAPERNAASLLGDGGRQLHRALARYNDGARWRLHYVTAREMFNIATAAMDGARGDPADYRDYEISPPPAARDRAGGAEPKARRERWTSTAR
jgi:hypothetical protein